MQETHELEVQRYTIERHHIHRVHTHENIEINFMERGDLRLDLCERIQVLKQGQLGVFWSSFPHRIHTVDNDSRFWWLTIPIRDFLGWPFAEAFLRRLMSGELLTDTGGNPDVDLALLRQWMQDLPDIRMHPVILLELQARLLRLQENLRESAPDSVEGSQGTAQFVNPKALTMAAFMTRHFNEAIGLQEIAGEVGLHPSYAARLFKRSFGTTVGRFLDQIRIGNVQNRLRQRPDRVLDIALACGYQSSSHFYESFRRVTGGQPRKFRPRV